MHVVYISSVHRVRLKPFTFRARRPCRWRLLRSDRGNKRASHVRATRIRPAAGIRVRRHIVPNTAKVVAERGFGNIPTAEKLPTCMKSWPCQQSKLES